MLGRQISTCERGGKPVTDTNNSVGVATARDTAGSTRISTNPSGNRRREKGKKSKDAGEKATDGPGSDITTEAAKNRLLTDT